MNILIAHWTNGLGEDCSSRVYAEFTNDSMEHCYVVSMQPRFNCYGIFPEDELTFTMEARS